MKISTSTSLITSLSHYGNAADLTKCFELAKKSGFDCLDASLHVYCHGDMPLACDGFEKWAEQVRLTADNMGISFNQTHGDALSGMEWDDPACPKREGFTERNLRCIKATKILGAKWMVVHPANLPHAPLYSREQAKSVNLEYLAPLVEEAKKQGIGLAIENMVDFKGNRRRYCGGDPYELLELVDTINDPSVGVCIDTGHAHIAGVNVGDFIRLAGKRVKALHIDDNLRDTDAHLLPFYGTADWKDISKALKDIDYQNGFAFELCWPDIPETATVKWLEFIHKLGESIISL